MSTRVTESVATDCSYSKSQYFHRTDHEPAVKLDSAHVFRRLSPAQSNIHHRFLHKLLKRGTNVKHNFPSDRLCKIRFNGVLITDAQPCRSFNRGENMCLAAEILTSDEEVADVQQVKASNLRFTRNLTGHIPKNLIMKSSHTQIKHLYVYFSFLILLCEVIKFMS